MPETIKKKILSFLFCNDLCVSFTSNRKTAHSCCGYPTHAQRCVRPAEARRCHRALAAREPAVPVLPSAPPGRVPSLGLATVSASTLLGRGRPRCPAPVHLEGHSGPRPRSRLPPARRHLAPAGQRPAAEAHRPWSASPASGRPALQAQLLGVGPPGGSARRFWLRGRPLKNKLVCLGFLPSSEASLT